MAGLAGENAPGRLDCLETQTNKVDLKIISVSTDQRNAFEMPGAGPGAGF
jgi:hypothetical protein